MSNRNIIVCDRCGNEEPCDRSHPDGWVKHDDVMDLCPSCVKSYCEWLKNEPTESGDSPCQQCGMTPFSAKTFADLQAELDDWRETHERIMSEQCATDERHCTCVPSLRRRIKEMEAKQSPTHEHLVALYRAVKGTVDDRFVITDKIMDALELCEKNPPPQGVPLCPACEADTRRVPSYKSLLDFLRESENTHHYSWELLAARKKCLDEERAERARQEGASE